MKTNFSSIQTLYICWKWEIYNPLHAKTSLRIHSNWVGIVFIIVIMKRHLIRISCGRLWKCIQSQKQATPKIRLISPVIVKEVGMIVGAKMHTRLKIRQKWSIPQWPVAYKYYEGKVKRTLRGEQSLEEAELGAGTSRKVWCPTKQTLLGHYLLCVKN